MSEAITLPALPDTIPMTQQGHDIVTRAAAVVVADHSTYELAGAMLRDVVTLKKSIQEEFKSSKAAAHEAHKKITALEAKMLEAPTKAESLLKKAMGDWALVEAKRRQEEERRLLEQARKDEEDRRIEAAIALEQAGHADVAESVLSAPAPVAVVTVPKPAAVGVSVRKVVKFRILDPSKINRPYLVPDEIAIRNQVKALGKDAEKLVGGIEVYEENELAVRVR